MYLLPRLQDRFGRRAWLVNGVAFAAYHVHTPWVTPGALLDSLALIRCATVWIWPCSEGEYGQGIQAVGVAPREIFVELIFGLDAVGE